MNIVLLSAVCISVLFQFTVGAALVFISKEGEFIDEEKRVDLIKKNNYATLLVLATSIINIFISIFIMSK
jgi:hypothetical protein